MKLLLDECLPKDLKHHFKGFEVKTVAEMKWAGKKNGELLALAAKQFDVFLTADQNLVYQQNLERTSLGVLVFVVPDSRLETFEPLVPKALEALKNINPKQIKFVKA